VSDLSQAAVRPVADAVAEGVRSRFMVVLGVVAVVALVSIVAAVVGWQVYLRNKLKMAQQASANPPSGSIAPK
jgi:hypothetical protein